jgi:UDP-glucose 4-epimerase
MVVPRFIAQAMRGEPLTVYGDGKQQRVFTYVGDVVEAMVRLMESRTAEGNVFNIAGQDEITIAGLADLVIRMTGSSSPVSYIPYEDVYGDGFEDMARRLADTSLLAATIGYRCETPLTEILETVIEFQQALVRSK